jgi:anti-anti-sigma factor
MRIQDDGDTLLVQPQGEVDLATVPELAAALGRCSNTHRLVICDLSEVTFMDSTGLRALVDARRREPERFVLGATSPQVQRLLDLTGTSSLFKHVDAVIQDAIAAGGDSP